MDIFEYKIPNFKMLWHIIKAALVWARDDIKAWRAPMIPIIIVFLVAAWYVDIVSAFLWLIFLTFLVYRWESRILGAIAIILLIVCPILLSIGQDPWAELIAVYAFFFLVMTVTLQIIDLKRSERHIPVRHEEN